ncbi:exonuclease SbcCD subunit D [Chloroflexota bacterium]
MVNGGRAPRRVLHSSDLHLMSIGDIGCRSLEALVDLALEAEVDLVVIVGDLFDHNRVDDDLISFAVEQLRQLSMPVVILPGNHDCLIPNSIYNKAELWDGATNIRIIRDPQGETLTLPDLGISIWGKAIVSYDGDIHPLAGAPSPRKNGQWHIAMAHGFYVGTDTDSFRGLQITEEEVSTSGQDYIALGHFPVFRCVCDEPVAYYCDAPYPSGVGLIVDLDEETGVQVTRYPLSSK